MASLINPYFVKPYVLDRETAPAFWLTEILWLPMATGSQTGNRFSLIEQWMPSGLGPPTPGAWSMGSLKTARASEVHMQAAFGLEWRGLAGSADTDGTYDLFEVTAPAGAGLPLRVLAQDEAMYVLDGSVVMTLDDEQHTAGAGAFGYFPAGSACSWRAREAGARLLLFHLPSGFDVALARSGSDADRLNGHLRATGTRLVSTGTACSQ